MRTLELSLDDLLEISKALGNELRLEIMKKLNEGPMNVNELASSINAPFSTTAINVKKLEDAHLIFIEKIPGRGTQKVSSKRYDRIVINLSQEKKADYNIYNYEMPVGNFINCDIEPTCGLLSESGIIHVEDDPRSFFEPKRNDAQLIWFKSGYVEYHFPNRIPRGSDVRELSFSAEICSEAPYYNEDWPSDITCSINSKELGVWTSPGDFGGKRGKFTPAWWDIKNTQYGILKTWKINSEGSFLDNKKISNLSIQDLYIEDKPFISIKIGVKKDSKNVGGMNIFGSKFGNYQQDLHMKVLYK